VSVHCSISHRVHERHNICKKQSKEMNFVNLLCFSAAVLVIVDGQSTTDDDTDKDEISKLIDTVAELRAELTKSAKRISKLEGNCIVKCYCMIDNI